jgi:hypothetical protein
MSFCGEGGGMVHLGWCCVVEEAQERVTQRLPCRSREGRVRGKGAGLGAPHGEEEDGGPGDAHARALRVMEAGGGRDRGGAPGSDIGRRRKMRHVGCAWWTADGSAALGRPEVNNSFSDLFK